MTLLYSSTAPTGWNALPLDIKQKFYDIASKGDWSATEAYDHLVPDHLKDNPDEVHAWMDGDPHLDIPDRDVSRIESGENGGEYSTENTIMEDASDNRARGADNMSDAEYEQVVADNATDAEIIEANFNGVSESSMEGLEAAGESIQAVDFLTEAVLPVIASVKVGTSVAKRFKTDEDKWGWGMIAAGVTAVVMASAAGPWIAGGYVVHRVTKTVHKMANQGMQPV